jgi:hypothetical protein
MGDYNGFFYGTLIFPQILKRVLSDNRPEVELSIDMAATVPAVLKVTSVHKRHERGG